MPGSLAQRGYGYKTEGSDFGILTPEYKYIGKAWYTRTIDIPKDRKNKNVELFLERVLWASRVFIDGKETDRQDALGTPHVHDLGKLTPGQHTLTVKVDNDMIWNIGDKGHAYGEYTQSIWNGIVGRIELNAYDPIRVKSVRTFPDITQDKLKIEYVVATPSSKKGKLAWSISPMNGSEPVLEGTTEKKFQQGENTILVTVDVSGKLEKWSEFNPRVYTLKSSIRSGKYSDTEETEFGFYKVSHNGTKILVNGKPVFLRGNLDCVHFPLTGYLSCDVKDWERIFKIYKDYGLNHARFHSWCPPEAAFKAADRIGIYLQAEGSMWIDWWMSEDMKKKGRPEMDTKGHPKGLGYDAPRDSFVVAEMNRVVDFYGNNPSFTMFCIGNELGNSDFDVMDKWIANLKKKDPRHLYAVSTARKITPSDDYIATHYIQGKGRTRGLNGPRTNWDFEKTYSKMDFPVIAHEIGQWPVYPKWSEIEKYTGVLKARNLQEFKEQAEKNGIGDQDVDFAMASGALNQIMYKYETESFLRTESCAGAQLLSMQDYQGQGEALIGWLDAFWDSKGITTPEKFREHFNTGVPLLRFEKFVWTNDETFNAQAQFSWNGNDPLTGECRYKITDGSGNVISDGTFGDYTFSLGSLTDLGKVTLDLSKITKAQKLNVELSVTGTQFRNSWDIWVYPAGLKADTPAGVIISDKLDDETVEALDNGKKVLLVANNLGTEESSVKAGFYPLYWSLTFFPGQGKTSIGLFKDKHPAFNEFPTSSHSNWQWETISKDAKGFILNDLPVAYKPIAQTVDDFHRNNKVGSIFELKVGKGKLLVCGYDLKNEDLPVARQLKKSLVNYVNSDSFDPETGVAIGWLKQKLPFIPVAEAVKVPEKFKGAVLYVEACRNMKEKNKSERWKPELDEVKVADDVTYTVKCEGVWKDDTETAWFGKNMEVLLKVTDGMLGTL